MKLTGRKIYKGTGEGEALVTTDGISFYGGVDPDTGKVVEVGHQLEGQVITDKVLVFLERSGSKIRMISPNARITISGYNKFKFMSGRIQSIIQNLFIFESSLLLNHYGISANWQILKSSDTFETNSYFFTF